MVMQGRSIGGRSIGGTKLTKKANHKEDHAHDSGIPVNTLVKFCTSPIPTAPSLGPLLLIASGIKLPPQTHHLCHLDMWTYYLIEEWLGDKGSAQTSNGTRLCSCSTSQAKREEKPHQTE